MPKFSAFGSLHYLIPLLAIVIAIASQYSGFDIGLAQLFYDQQTQSWPYKDSWLTQTVIHRGGRDVVVLLASGTLVFFILSFFVAHWRKWRRATGYLLGASLTSVIIIGQLKGMTHIYSPWDLQIFAGPYPHIRLFDPVPANSPIGLGFPAGHAGGGYALLSIYFLLRATQHRYQYHFLVLAIMIGITFGFAQQMRGAHMLSHDLFTFAICWTSCLVWAAILLHRQHTIPTPAIR